MNIRQRFSYLSVITGIFLILVLLLMEIFGYRSNRSFSMLVLILGQLIFINLLWILLTWMDKSL